MPSRQAGEHDSQNRAALLYNLQSRIDDQVMFASTMQGVVVHAMGPRVAEPATHMTPLAFIQGWWD
jgi:hypothetical protein